MAHFLKSKISNFNFLIWRLASLLRFGLLCPFVDKRRFYEHGKENRDNLKKPTCSFPFLSHHKVTVTIVTVLKTFTGGAAIAEWIRLCLTSCHPGFESQAPQLCFYQFIFELCHDEKTKVNK